MLEESPRQGKPLPRAFVERAVTLVLTALGFVAALAWNEAIQELVGFIFPQQNGLVAKFGYALAITLVLVIASIRLGRIGEGK